MPKLSDEQNKAINYIIGLIKTGVSQYSWYYWPKNTHIKIAGYAGTGKTFLLSRLRKEIDRLWPGSRVAMVTFTGKASSVLKTKIRENGADNYGDYIGTIHGLIYIPILKYNSKLKRKVIVGWEKKSKSNLDAEIILIDEASMVSNKMLEDLQSYNRPIVVFGDNGQLPPIGDQGTILDKPHIQLKTIHRQALNSPIIKLAHYVRKGGRVPSNRMFSNEVFKLSWNDPQCQNLFNQCKIDENVIILCAFNSSRCILNNTIRERLGCKQPEPHPGERVICLLNNYDSGLMNGQISTVVWYMPELKNCFRLTLQQDSMSDPLEIYAHNLCFGKEKYSFYDDGFFGTKEYKECLADACSKGFESVNFFDYGYAISVHKSQGSEWDRVILFEQSTSFWDYEYYNKWLYTAITRAKKKLFIIENF